MEKRQAPCFLLYDEKEGKYTVIRDHLGMFNSNQNYIIAQLEQILANHKQDATLIEIEEKSYYVNVIQLKNEETLFVIIPYIEQGLFAAVELEKALRDQQQRLFELIKSKTIKKQDIQAMLQEICETFSILIDCDRVSIWIFNEDQTVLQCRNLYDKKTHKHSFGAELHTNNLPLYIKEVNGNRSLAVSDVTTDDRVKELADDYSYFYKMGGVKSLLDVPLVLSTGINGLLCCDSFTQRSWSELDQTIAGMLSDMVSFLFERINRMELDEKMLQLAYLDPLTGLLNYQSFIEQVNEKMKELRPNEKGLMVYLQLDQFNSIQDVLGYSSGDEVLTITAQRLLEIIPENGIISRMGFGHFAMFLLANEDGESKYIDFEKLANNLDQPMYIQGQDVYVTHSYGVSVYPEHGQDANKCIQMAQIALNTGMKHHARSVKARFSKDMFHVIEDDLLAEMNLRKGLDYNEFELYYQPQIDSFSGRIIGFEALIRWNHPDKGLISPAEFISLAESTGLILPIGEWVIDQALTQLENMENEGKTYSISINISPRHFLHSSLYVFLKAGLQKYNINPNQLIIEITENVAMEDFDAVKKRILELSRLGFSVSIDDFGTGFSAFQYLQHFPVHEIKIDRQFIRDITNNEISMSIAKTIIDLAKLLKLDVVSEGVETEEQWEMLRNLGCPKLQGYYFSKPMPFQDIQNWVKTYEEVGMNRIES